VVAMIFRSLPDTQPQPQPLLDQQIILNDFKNIKHEAYTAGNYKPDSIYSPYDYTGDKSDEFYLTIRNKEDIVTLKYVLQEDSSGKLKYILKNRWPDVNLPPDRFESYKYENSSWVNTNQL
jgi:hypothetical protein